ncbi:MAG TPA: hypothetical protein VNW15_06480, partial [Rhizomicrobium sp.]|nr:hypothetical protein [Rhizomicrobium sp.]
KRSQASVQLLPDTYCYEYRYRYHSGGTEVKKTGENGGKIGVYAATALPVPAGIGRDYFPSFDKISDF